ncbi:hypothetical protein RclHR1_01960006 [Rhizophagus clarus]|uniref:Uncharacterized protein n=1 Tax=Rhizophagus clarus TaxID=94130 RepID=A0A2Z6RI38_9GLOM|nr:hypothetical protein RclHR1_01960006 [Rhizophagus clarus]GES78542.1 hypothetical protein GLOIN_2v1765706 [Rhizophagus clarus]
MSSSADNININLHCLIVPCGELHTLSHEQVMQIVTVGRSQAVSDLVAIIQSRLEAPFNSIRLKIRQVYPSEALMQPQDLIFTFFNEQSQEDYFHVVAQPLSVSE